MDADAQAIDRGRSLKLWLSRQEGDADIVQGVLSRYMPCGGRAISLRRDDSGKPRLNPANGIDFNLSHCPGRTAMAVSFVGSVGIDIEELRPRKRFEEISKRCFHPKDQLFLARCPVDNKHRHFHALWVLKEAQLKCVSERLFTAPRISFSETGILDIDEHTTPWLPCPANPDTQLWLRLWWLGSSHAMAVCIDSWERPAVDMRWWPMAQPVLPPF